MSDYKVGYVIGSLARASLNRKLARVLVRLAPKELEMTEIPFGDLPLHSYINMVYMALPRSGQAT